ncbi:MAG: hypothetical protein MUC92_08895 [Fimbriimonadaceae bacterium]|jgi:hypothetical protein|nr:hypothetical protein [Fimbriimonadaceae bacterium]
MRANVLLTSLFALTSLSFADDPIPIDPPNLEPTGWVKISGLNEPFTQDIELRRWSNSGPSAVFYTVTDLVFYDWYKVYGYSGSLTPPWSPWVSILSNPANDVWVVNLPTRTVEVRANTIRQIFITQEIRAGTETWGKRGILPISRDLDSAVWTGAIVELEYPLP